MLVFNWCYVGVQFEFNWRSIDFILVYVAVILVLFWIYFGFIFGFIFGFVSLSIFW